MLKLDNLIYQRGNSLKIGRWNWRTSNSYLTFWHILVQYWWPFSWMRTIDIVYNLYIINENYKIVRFFKIQLIISIKPSTPFFPECLTLHDTRIPLYIQLLQYLLNVWRTNFTFQYNPNSTDVTVPANELNQTVSFTPRFMITAYCV